MSEMNKEALKAWKALSDSEAEKYRKETEKSRPSKKETCIIAAFMSLFGCYNGLQEPG